MHVFKLGYVGFGLAIMRTEVGKSVSNDPKYKTIFRYFYYRDTFFVESPLISNAGFVLDSSIVYIFTYKAFCILIAI